MRHASLRRRFAAALVLGLVAAPAAVAQQIPVRSGLPWPSGVTAPLDAFAAWRGRPADLRTVFWRKDSWDGMRANAKSKPDPLQMAIGFPMLPVSHKGELEACAAGAFDAQMRVVRDTMLANGWGGSYIRLGWEANRVDRSVFPWAAEGGGASWTACFRRWVGILNPGRVKNFPIVWNMANKGSFPYPIQRLWPGSDVVDVAGSQFYDRCPPITTEEEWQARINARDQWGNPAGPQAWLEFARSKGKKWAMPEWGVGGSQTVCRRAGIDNPFFIRKVREFLGANAADVAFESYFNGSDSTTGTHAIYPVDANPASAAAYQQLW